MNAKDARRPVLVLTVVEHSISRKGTYERRWLILNDRGGQSALVYHTLQRALQAAAWETLAWKLWTEESNTFCR